MRKNQKGFTLIELLIVTAVGGILVGVLVPSVFQLTRYTDNNTTRITAVNQIENTAHWLSQDGQMAQSTDLAEGMPANTLTLYWTDWTDWGECTGQSYPDEEADFKAHSITYSLVGGEIQRSYDGSITTIAEHIADIEFSLSGSVITATVTSSPKGDDWPAEKRTYNINLRPVNESPLHY